MPTEQTKPLRQPRTALPVEFPRYGYTPFGYLDNPAHSAVLNRSGIIRSVPPVGFGFWCRRMPWPYGEGARRQVNYLSFLELAFQVNGVLLQTSEDFTRQGTGLRSEYHTKHMLSYDFAVEGVEFSAQYFLASEKALVCILEMENRGETAAKVTIHATNVYGFPEQTWWGSDGISTNFVRGSSALVSKIFAYGDVFVLGADHHSRSHKATAAREVLQAWIQSNDRTSVEHAEMEFPGAMYALQSYDLTVLPHATQKVTLALVRGPNQKWALETYQQVLEESGGILNGQLAEDARFYRGAPLLEGSFPQAWKEGWIYDLETIRMNIRPPLGIYQHHWDGMQVFTPRLVLGEAMLDALCLSYSDLELSKEVVFGTFADAPMENVPCSREDGSMNMTGASGEECGTAPIWGLPFVVIQSIYNRSQDTAWLEALYPFLRKFVDWWVANRTDSDGWFHCDNSWESGQDGSRRFTFEGGNEAAAADFVRTVDVEAAMASAMTTMAHFASILGRKDEVEYWQRKAQLPVTHARSMFVDGWFHDFDGRTGQPIILQDYYDVMMLMPLSVGIATQEQVEAIRPMFQYFREHPMGWLEWPSFMFPFTEAAWNAGMTGLAAEALADIGNLIYGRTTGRGLKPVGSSNAGLPKEYHYRIPGVATEFWPKQLHEKYQNGAENYGWGATFPSLVIRNLFGFRETDDGFDLAPVIPANLIPGDETRGKTFGISNLAFRDARFKIEVTVVEEGKLAARLEQTGGAPVKITIRSEGSGKSSSRVFEGGAAEFSGPQAARYHVILQS